VRWPRRSLTGESGLNSDIASEAIDPFRKSRASPYVWTRDARDLRTPSKMADPNRPPAMMAFGNELGQLVSSGNFYLCTQPRGLNIYPVAVARPFDHLEGPDASTGTLACVKGSTKVSNRCEACCLESGRRSNRPRRPRCRSR
jgi:hypothetical protein